MMIDQEKALALRKYIVGLDGNGLPYKELACGWDGCNCVGLVELFYKTERGILLPNLHRQETSRANIAVWFSREIRRAWVPVDSAAWSDCAVFDRGNDHGHVGIMIDPVNMLHIEKGADACIEAVTSMANRTKFAGFYRYAG